MSTALEVAVRSGFVEVLGVHVIGDRAAEIVHIGQAVMAMGAPSNTSAIRCSTIRLWRKRTKWPRSTV